MDKFLLSYKQALRNLDFDVFTLFFIIRSVFIRMLRHASAGDRRRIYITGTAEREGLVVL